MGYELSRIEYELLREQDSRRFLRWFDKSEDGADDSWEFYGLLGKIFLVDTQTASDMIARARHQADINLSEETPDIPQAAMAFGALMLLTLAMVSTHEWLLSVAIFVMIFTFGWIGWSQLLRHRLRFVFLRLQIAKELEAAGQEPRRNAAKWVLRQDWWTRLTYALSSAFMIRLFFKLPELVHGFAALDTPDFLIATGAWAAYWMARRSELYRIRRIAPLIGGYHPVNPDTRRSLDDELQRRLRI